MTVQAIEGTLKIPAASRDALDEEVGFAPQAKPPGQMAISEGFRPNPNDDASSSALFNIFLESHDFAGEVYLLKEAPSETKEFQGCKFRVLSRGSEMAWPIAPDEHFCDTMQEPENGVAYYLAAWGETAGQEIYYRMSL